ncbi:MAG: phytanoyl-CoA dioxygenase family protein [Gallionellaceae bacterium]
MNSVRHTIRVGRQVVRVTRGLVSYMLYKQTPVSAFYSMRALFCMTNGRSNDWLSRLIGIFKSPYRFSNTKGILGEMTDDKRSRIAATLRERGYYVFENRLPGELCDRLLQFATSHTCKIRPMDGDKLGKPVDAVYHRDAPRAVRYDFDTQDLLNNPDVQKVIADLSFAAVSQDYLGARPVLDVLSMWWHTSFSDKPDMAAAQYYHFDMDRPKWLKFFIYLTDVESTNGPHTFVAGSHRTGAIPPSLLEDRRLTDEEVERQYDRKDIIEFSAPRGTILAEDTRGLHKGKHVETGDRLLLQLQFSNSLFGMAYTKVTLGKDLTEELKKQVAKYPELYSAYLPVTP